MERQRLYLETPIPLANTWREQKATLSSKFKTINKWYEQKRRFTSTGKAGYNVVFLSNAGHFKVIPLANSYLSNAQAYHLLRQDIFQTFIVGPTYHHRHGPPVIEWLEELGFQPRANGPILQLPAADTVVPRIVGGIRIIPLETELRNFTDEQLHSAFRSLADLLELLSRAGHLAIHEGNRRLQERLEGNIGIAEVEHQIQDVNQVGQLLLIAGISLRRLTILLRVRTLTGKEIELDIEIDYKVSQIKEKVEEKEGIPPVQQRLIFGGKQMVDDKTAAEYNLEGGATLHLVLALRGGR